MKDLRHDGEVRTLIATFSKCTIRIKTDIVYTWSFLVLLDDGPHWGFCGSRFAANERSIHIQRKAGSKVKPELVKLEVAA